MFAHFHNPVHSVFGAGALSSLPGLLDARSCALVVFPEARGFGLTGRIEALLGSSLRCVIEDVRPNPDVAELAGTYRRFWSEHADADVLIAVGGGSAIDTAKALMVANDT